MKDTDLPSGATTKVAAPPPSPRLLRGMICAALGVMLLWSCRAFFDYGELWMRLAGKTLPQRGRIGCDEGQSFLARAGRVVAHAEHAKSKSTGSPTEGPSGNALTWAWTVETERTLPGDARVCLDRCNSFLEYGATFLWYPRVVRTLALDGEATRRTPAQLVEQLRQSGCTHIVTPTPRGIALLDLSTLRGR